MLRILRMRRIVDCRDEYDKPVADSIALEKYPDSTQECSSILISWFCRLSDLKVAGW